MSHVDPRHCWSQENYVLSRWYEGLILSTLHSPSHNLYQTKNYRVSQKTMYFNCMWKLSLNNFHLPSKQWNRIEMQLIEKIFFFLSPLCQRVESIKFIFKIIFPPLLGCSQRITIKTSVETKVLMRVNIFNISEKLFLIWEKKKSSKDEEGRVDVIWINK